jgi:Uma2 family endonuclease
MSAIEQTGLLTIEEFVRLYDREGPFEIIDGERKPIMPPVLLHGMIVRLLWRLLDPFCVAHGLGEVFTDVPFVLTYRSAWVKGSRVPDLMFFSAARWQVYMAEASDQFGKPVILIPDLAVEVVSPNDLHTEIQNKVVHYLADGVRLIWVIDPTYKRIQIYEGERYTTVEADGVLTGSEVIPGFSVAVAELFPA